MKSEQQEMGDIDDNNPFSRQQLVDFARGRIEDASFEAAMLKDLIQSPNGQVARYLYRIEQRATRILDERDNIYFGRTDVNREGEEV